MNLNFIIQGASAMKLALKAKAPALMLAGGLASVTAGTVIACKQTLELDDVLESHVEELNNVSSGEDLKLESYTSEHARNDRINIYIRAGLDVSRLYAVPGVLMFSGMGLILGAHHIMAQRNATLALAFTGLKTAFDKYRENVREEYGEDVDTKMMRGRVKPVTEINEKGEKVTTLKYENNDPYNRVFDQTTSTSWKPDLSVNNMFLSNQQRFAQERLNMRGYLYLSEVYEALGIPESSISRVVGWKIRRNPDGSKDFPMVDFGINKPHPDDDLYARDSAVYLDFNCQGLIVGGKVQKILEKS